MVLCVKCSVDTRRQLDLLVVSEGYRDYAEVVADAIANLAMVTSETGKKGAVFIERPAEFVRNRAVSPPAVQWEGNCC